MQSYESTLAAATEQIAGLPALSVPCGFTDAGLPIGLQIIGRAFDEATVLRVGHAYQSAVDWPRWPPVGAAGFASAAP
ncbi:hypothetical protein A5647_19065 [Mycobacterium sp. 1100029.7]|nr:hypothetical protein A5647_19065 [Mycobacterium sp. 1100029.7]